jgi:hypothetical protein
VRAAHVLKACPSVGGNVVRVHRPVHARAPGGQEWLPVHPWSECARAVLRAVRSRAWRQRFSQVQERACRYTSGGVTEVCGAADKTHTATRRAGSDRSAELITSLQVRLSSSSSSSRCRTSLPPSASTRHPPVAQP